MGAAVAPPAGFNSTMQLLKRQLNKITVLVEFVIQGGLRTQSVYQNSYSTIATFIETTVCACVHTRWFFLPHSHCAKGTSFSSPLNELLVGSIGSIVNSDLANDSKKLAL